jgi:hypothetical protein
MKLSSTVLDAMRGAALVAAVSIGGTSCGAATPAQSRTNGPEASAHSSSPAPKLTDTGAEPETETDLDHAHAEPSVDEHDIPRPCGRG